MPCITAPIERRNERIQDEWRDEEPTDDPRHERDGDIGDRRQQEQESAIRAPQIAIPTRASATEPRVGRADDEKERLGEAAAENEPLPEWPAPRRGEKSTEGK